MSPEVRLMIGVQEAWQGNGTLTELVPGGLREGRLPITGPDAATLKRPYAQLMVNEGDKEFFSSIDYLQKFTVAIKVYDDPGRGVVKAGDHQLATALTLDWDGVTVHSARVVWVRPVTGELKEDERSRDGKDVVVATMNWEVTLQLVRPR